MIEHFNIEQFRGLQNLTLQNLGNVNIFVGGNNVGKTSVLEAIAIYSLPLDLLNWVKIARDREINSLRYFSMLESLKWLFPQNSKSIDHDFDQSEILLSGQGSFVVKELRAIYQEIQGTIDHTQQYNEDTMSALQIGADIEIKIVKNEPREIITDNFQIWENQPIINKRTRNNPFINAEIIRPFSHFYQEFSLGLLSMATYQNFKQDVITLLQIVHPEIIDLQILFPPTIQPNLANRYRPSIYIQHKKLGFAPLTAFGDGVRRLLFMALNLAQVKGGILLIDELETAIHTEALPQSFSWLIQWCEKMKVQLFATTHSLEVVDVLLDITQFNTDLVLYKLDEKENHTQGIRLDRDKLKTIRERLGNDVR